jgi:hypothetical protein
MPVVLIVVPIAAIVLAINRADGLGQLLDILGCTGIEGILDRRLVGTDAATKCVLECEIAAQARVDPRQTMRPAKIAIQAS